jgi:hypothetical protein
MVHLPTPRKAARVLTLLEIVDRGRQPPTPTTAALVSTERLESNHAPGAAGSKLRPLRTDLVTFPAAQPGNRMYLGHGRPPAVLMCGNNKLAVTTVSPLNLPRRSEKNQKKAPSEEGAMLGENG